MAFKGNLLQLSDLMTERQSRPGKAVYFIRIDAFNAQVDEVLKEVVFKAKESGILLDGKLPSPDVQQTSCYQEVLGDEFELNLQFMDNALAKWVPKVPQDTRNGMSDALLRMMTILKKSGKNENVLKNAFIKYMCWIMYKFHQVLTRIEDNATPVIVYDAKVSVYELQMMMILCCAGCDIVLLQTQNEDYQKLDPEGRYAQCLKIENGQPFPADYSIKSIVEKLSQERIQHPVSLPRPLQPATHFNSVPSIASHLATPVKTEASKPSVPRASVPLKSTVPPIPKVEPPKSTECHAEAGIDLGPASRFKVKTNTWCTSSNALSNILTPVAIRSINVEELCNVFILESGVENVATYETDLYQFYREMLDSKRRLVIAKKNFEVPTADEIAQLHRGNYNQFEGMIKDLSMNFVIPGNFELQKLAVHAFGNVMHEYGCQPNITLAEAMKTAIYLICWFRRCQKKLFDSWNAPSIGCFIYVGGCHHEQESLFLRLLAYMPVDVLILNPNLNDPNSIQDKRLKINFSLTSHSMDAFPTERRNIRITTEAYQAERDLDELTDDSGIYRSQQFKRAESFALHTSFHEVLDLWDMPVSDRSNFDIVKGVVNIPTLFTKISGVEHEKEEDYWRYVRSFMISNSYTIKQLPNMSLSKLGPIAASMKELYVNGKLQRDRIKAHRNYPYTLIRSDMQEHMLDMIEEMIRKKIIRGTGERNTDFMIVASALSLDKPIQRLLQEFDFTQKNPKLLVLNTGETVGSIQDAIQFAFLNFIGFDILFFVPSGYQCIEQWYQMPLITEHCIGDYQYYYTIPDFESVADNPKQSWFDRFKRS